jgi:broad specificity phosphatase PhoE
MAKIVLLRHAERLDRAMEEKGLNWICNAKYPQDPPLSEFGCDQAKKIGSILSSLEITHMYVSPMIRTVMTADLVSREFSRSIPLWIEPGMIEEAKSFRGRHANEPKPVWTDNRLYQTTEFLKENYCHLIDLSFEPLQEVAHSRDESTMNEIRENHAILSDENEITRDRCSQFISKLKLKHQQEQQNDHEGFRILCVGHGASCSGCANTLEEGLPDHLKIRGVRSVGTWAVYVPFDESNPDGPWYCPEGVWQSLPAGEVGQASENIADRGDGV